MNKYKTFNHDLNQGDLKKQWYMCTFFAAAMNLYYNTGIKLTEIDLEIIAEEQSKAGVFSYTAGGKGKDAFNAILRYIKKLGKSVELKSISSDADVLKYLKQDYMVTTGIAVNPKWKEEVLDGKIDTKDYKTLKGTEFKHYLNMIIDGQVSGYDISLVDNYFFNTKNRPNLYSAILKEVLEDIDQNIKYLFI